MTTETKCKVKGCVAFNAICGYIKVGDHGICGAPDSHECEHKTTETEIEEICRRLGWSTFIDRTGNSFVYDAEEKPYLNPETNADLHMRWMVEHEIGTNSPEGMQPKMWCAKSNLGGDLCWGWTPYEAIRAALLAKLRSEQDD